MRAGTSPWLGMTGRESVNTASVAALPDGCRVFCLFFSGKMSVQLIQSRITASEAVFRLSENKPIPQHLKTQLLSPQDKVLVIFITWFTNHPSLCNHFVFQNLPSYHKLHLEKTVIPIFSLITFIIFINFAFYLIRKKSAQFFCIFFPFFLLQLTLSVLSH